MKEKIFDEGKYKREFRKKAYDRVELQLKKGRKEELLKQANAQGKSLNAFLIEIIEKETGV